MFWRSFTKHKDLYLKADPNYDGRYTVPVIWDKKNETIVSNESSEIIRMLYSEFDEFLPEDIRESKKPDGGLLPSNLKQQIDEQNEWVYNNINNAVYKVMWISLALMKTTTNHIFRPDSPRLKKPTKRM